MNKYSYLLKNFSVLTIASLGTKVISIILIPLYTSIISTYEYGEFDIICNTIVLFVPIMSLNICESIIRFCIENIDDRKLILGIANKYMMIGTVFFAIFLLINYNIQLISPFNNHLILTSLIFLSSLIVTLITSYAKAIDLIKELAISGLISSLVTAFCNVLFLLKFEMRIDGFLLAVILGEVVQCIYLGYKTNILSNIQLADFRIDTILEKKMLIYSIPLAFNSLFWWINSSSDRYIISFVCGLEATGIYSMAYRIPSLLSLINNVFNQAWTISAIREYNSKERDSFFSMVFRTYNYLIIIICSLIVIGNKMIALVLFKKEFFLAWKCAPLLLVSFVFGSSAGFLGCIYSAMKKTRITSITVMCGALINIILNMLLVRRYSIIGAALATLVSYLVVFIIRYLVILKKYKINISIKRECLMYSVLIIQAIIAVYIVNLIVMYTLEILLFVVLIVIGMPIFYKDMLPFIKNHLRKSNYE